jgi:formate-dependent nitrite reductase membrane component NrfD
VIGAEHYVAPPLWEWWILGYFFFGGLAGGSYTIGTLLRFVGTPSDQRLARTAYLVSFLALLPCPIFLIADLGQPLRFINMLYDASAGGLSFKSYSPMSVGSWMLLFFGIFSFVSFLGALGDGQTRTLAPFTRVLKGTVGVVWAAIGTFFALFVAGYTGVLLAVSNQPVWSDAAWVLGGLFVASALTGSAALLIAVAHWRRVSDAGTTMRLVAADRNFALLETVVLLLFVVSVAAAGTIGRLLGVWLVLWLVVLIGLAAPFTMSRIDALRRWPPVTGPAIALLGVLALRALVIFGPQV